jgi:hypothetical protein
LKLAMFFPYSLMALLSAQAFAGQTNQRCQDLLNDVVLTQKIIAYDSIGPVQSDSRETNNKLTQLMGWQKIQIDLSLMRDEGCRTNDIDINPRQYVKDVLKCRTAEIKVELSGGNDISPPECDKDKWKP